MRILPRSPTTRCQGMPFPEGVAAMARPALRAPPGKRKARASAPYVKTRPRGICFTKRYTGSQVTATPSPFHGMCCERHRRCVKKASQEKKSAAGFNKMWIHFGCHEENWNKRARKASNGLEARKQTMCGKEKRNKCDEAEFLKADGTPGSRLWMSYSLDASPDEVGKAALTDVVEASYTTRGSGFSG
jgi:hypothetical protein